MRQGGPKFGREHLRHLSVCIAPAGEERVELLWGVAPVHIEGENSSTGRRRCWSGPAVVSCYIPRWCSCVLGKLGY